MLLWFVTHGVLLFTDEILYDKFFLKAFLKAINLFVNLKMDEMTLEKFRLWNTAALKVYLSVREKSIEGSFDELASRYNIDLYFILPTRRPFFFVKYSFQF